MPMKANAISWHIPAPEAIVRTVPYGGGGEGGGGGSGNDTSIVVDSHPHACL